jgi:hypothetical protein
MPSLFVWKATSPFPSTSITYYSGSNWFLEEHSTYSRSAMYLNQHTLSNHGWVYDIKTGKINDLNFLMDELVDIDPLYWYE